MKGLEKGKQMEKGLVLLDFYANWCGPCQTMEPILNRIVDAFDKNLKVVRIDVDKNRPVATNFKIKSVPTFILLKAGKPVWRKSNLLSERDLKDAIQAQF